MNQYLTIDDIADMFKVGRRTVSDHWVHRPDFPAPALAPSRRSRRWDRDDIIAWATPAGRKSARQTLGNRSTTASSSLDAR
ncbi:MAG: helix-turn-helix domain-containing protein [Limnohabitans sp.]